MNASGLILDTLAWSNAETTDLLLLAIEKFQISHVVVLGHDRLHAELVRQLNKKALFGTEVIKLTKSGGVVQRDGTLMRALGHKRFKEYFHGNTSRTELTPYSSTASFDELKLYKIKDGPLLFLLSKSTGMSMALNDME